MIYIFLVSLSRPEFIFFVLWNLILLLKVWQKKNYLFCFKMWDARWFVYLRIMNRSDNMGGGNTIYAMEITRGKPRRVWCIIERIKQHHEDHKRKSFYLTSSLLLDFTCNHRFELELDLWETKKICKEKL